MLPSVHTALVALLHKMQEDRLQVKRLLLGAAPCLPQQNQSAPPGSNPMSLQLRLMWLVVSNTLQLAAGIALDEGLFRPTGWRPLCPQQWLAHHLLEHKPARVSEQAAAAAAGAAGGVSTSHQPATAVGADGSTPEGEQLHE